MEWNFNKTNIALAYSNENLKILLDKICKKENSFSHYDFSEWCDNLTMAFEERDQWNVEDTLTVSIARDIECQWDLFLINTYSLTELQSLDLSEVELPRQWFIEWREELKKKKT